MANDQLTARPTPLAVGEAAPDFTLPDQNKAEWKLSDHVKKGDVVLCFVPFAFTGVCSTEMNCVSKDVAAWSKQGATVVGINCDSMFANKAWAEKEGYTHTILADLHRAVCRAFGVHWADMNVATRATVVIGKDPSGKGRVKFIETRQPGSAMKWEDVLTMIS
jgi:peroxiredoxin